MVSELADWRLARYLGSVAPRGLRLSREAG
jgi:hypothetical protein